VFIHRAGLSIVPVVPWEGALAADQLPNFYHAVLTFERFSVRLNVTTTKKVLNFLGKKCTKCTATYKKILASRYVGMGPPEWLIRR